jgi:Protein of unknown function (DUF2889).
MKAMLSKAAPRERLHTREIVCHGYRRQDGWWDIEGTMEDTKTYSFANHDRSGIAAGEPVHRMHIRLTLDDELLIHAAEAVTEAGPFSICGDITPVFASLVGLRIGAGWRRDALERMRGVHGCTHLTELLLGPITTTAMQTIRAARQGRESTRSGRPPVIGTCHALAPSSPVVARQWPEHYTPEA